MISVSVKSESPKLRDKINTFSLQISDTVRMWNGPGPGRGQRSGPPFR